MEYSYQDMVKMQEDAAKRVQDMRRRARLYVDDENEKAFSENAHERTGVSAIPDKVRVISLPVDPLVQSRQDENKEVFTQNPPSKAADSALGSLSSIVNSDSALILSLCILLQAEKADEGLIMALLYLLV